MQNITPAYIQQSQPLITLKYTRFITTQVHKLIVFDLCNYVWQKKKKILSRNVAKASLFLFVFKNEASPAIFSDIS